MSIQENSPAIIETELSQLVNDSKLAKQCVLIGLAVMVFHDRVRAWASNVDRQYRRAEKLAAYKKRRKWKASDITNLNSLDVGQPALKRMKRLTGKGRPVVKPHQPLEAVIAAKIRALLLLASSDCTASERKTAFRESPWWEHHIEALYRGERDLAQAKGTASPATYSEELVASASGISAAKVHAVCTKIRRLRREDANSADFPPMLLAEYEKWMQTGKIEWPIDRDR